MIYIYALVCPFSGIVRYIGKCKNLDNRFYRHLNKARAGNPTHHHSTRWIRNLLTRGAEPIMRKLLTLSDNADWQHFEKVTIARYRRAGFDLTNLTGGGDGFHDVSPEVVARSVAARKAWMSIPENRERLVAAVTASWSLPGRKEKISRIIRASWLDPDIRARFLAGMAEPEARKRRSLASIRRLQDPEQLARHCARMKDVHSTPEMRKAARLRSLAIHADPQISQRRRESIRMAFANPEVKARLTEAIRKSASRPEVRSKLSRATTAHFSDPENRKKRLEIFRSEKVRTKMSASAKSKWKDPEFLAATKLRTSSPEHRAKLSEAAKRRATPEYRAMMAEKRRQAWQRQKSQKQG